MNFLPHFLHTLVHTKLLFRMIIQILKVIILVEQS